MSCLGELLTALVDGELDHDERDRALAHLAGCQECRAEADTLRRLKGRLRALASPPPEQAEALPPGSAVDLPSVDFLTKLYAMGEHAGQTGQTGRPARRAPARTPRGVPKSVGSRPRDNRPTARAGHAAAVARRLPRRRYLAVGAAAAVVFGLTGASYAAGGEGDRRQPVMPAFEKLETEHALTNGVVPLSDISPGP